MTSRIFPVGLRCRAIRRVVICVYVAAVAAITGCERTSPAPRGNLPSEGDVIVLIGPARPSPQWLGVTGGARRIMDRYPGVVLKCTAPSDKSVEALTKVVSGALTDRPRAICVYVTDPIVARPAIEMIRAAATILVTMGVDPAARGVFGHVLVDTVGAAETLGMNLAAVACGKHSYLLLHENDVTAAGTRCYERFMQKARLQPGMSLLWEQSTSQTEQSSADLVRAMFHRFPHAGLVVTLNASPWLSTAPADLLGSEARFATLDTVPALWPYLLNDQAAALAGPLHGEIGSLAVELAMMGITESERPGTVRVVNSELVTAETVYDFAARYAEAAGFELGALLPGAGASQPVAASRPAGEP